MPLEYEGGVSAADTSFAIIASRFNQMITQRLLEGALDCLQKHGADRERGVEIVYCPGAFEIPQVAAKITLERRYDAVICLGAIIRGETPHFGYVARECARGVGAVARDRGVPVLFGVLTTDTYDQALERSGGTVGNKGWDAALAAIRMADLYRQLRKHGEEETAR